MANVNIFMAHRCGFTEKALVATLQACGFGSVISLKRGASRFDLWAIATKDKQSEDQLRSLARLHLPVAGA